MAALTVFIGLTACATPPGDVATIAPDASFTAPLTWQYAEVVPGRGAVKAALLVPISVDGVRCLAQLDTGLPGALMWKTPPAQTSDAVVTVRVAGKTQTMTPPSSLRALLGGDCSKRLVASIGNAFFDDGSVIIDLLHDRLTTIADAALATTPRAQTFSYPRSPGNNGNGAHIVVELGMADGRREQAMFDTGAAYFGLSVFDMASWRSLGGPEALDAAHGVTSFSVGSWGHQIACYEAPSAQRVVLAQTLAIDRLTLSYCVQAAFTPGQPLTGLIGLRYLDQHIITFDFLSRRWTIE